MKRLISVATVVGITLFGPAAIGGSAAHATVPGKNGRIAFFLDRGRGGEIYTIKRDGSGLRRLTHLDGNATDPDWSPDGTRIVFWLEDQALYVMNADGSHLHQVTAPGGVAAFTPDGHHLVYACSACPGGGGIFLMRANGSDAPGRRLSKNPFRDGDDSAAQVSPDGRTVAIYRRPADPKLSALYAMNIHGQHLRKLTPSSLGAGHHFDWAPDGRHLLFLEYADYSNDPDRTANVATIRSDGSHLRMLTKQRWPHVAVSGSYSPDGRWIAFRRENQMRGYFALWKMHPDGTHRRLIARMRFAPRSIDWGPQASP